VLLPPTARNQRPDSLRHTWWPVSVRSADALDKRPANAFDHCLPYTAVEEGGGGGKKYDPASLLTVHSREEPGQAGRQRQGRVQHWRVISENGVMVPFIVVSWLIRLAHPDGPQAWHRDTGHQVPGPPTAGWR